MKILAYIAAYDGTSLFRVLQPLKAVAKNHDVCVRFEQKYHNKDIDWADVIIFQRQQEEHVYPYLDYAKSKGKKTILEFDDLLTDVPEWSSAHAFYKDIKHKIINFVKRVDACIVSTEKLRTWALQYNPNVYVVPNSIDLKAFEEKPKLEKIVFFDYNQRAIEDREAIFKKLEKKTKIMWWGSNTHLNDLALLEFQLHDLAVKYPDILVVMMGCISKNMLTQFIASGLKNLVCIDGIETGYFHPCLNYIGKLGRTIAVAPLVDIPFNQAKSNLKVLEAWAMGAPMVASDVTEYSKTLTRSSPMNMLVGKEQDWKTPLEELVLHPGMSKFVGECGRDSVETWYCVDKMSKVWYDTFVQIKKGEPKSSLFESNLN